MFKAYSNGQIMLLPVDLKEEIETNHLVQVVNTTVEKMDLRTVYAQYAGGGTSSYYPKMLLKVLLNVYSQQLYSSRKIAKALRENIYFMWLSGYSHPHFHTINRFRGVVLKETMGDIFAAVLTILIEGGYVKLENYFVDGSKLEANTSKYSFVWAKNTERYKGQVQEKVARLLEQIEQINAAEDAEYGERDLPERGGDTPLSAAELEAKIKALNERLRQLSETEAPEVPERAPKTVAEEVLPGEMGREANVPQSKPRGNKRKQRQASKAQRLAKGIAQLAEDFLPRLQKYEAQETLLNGRNSYAKTDPDATFMRMKEDHMRNGQLKAVVSLFCY